MFTRYFITSFLVKQLTKYGLQMFKVTNKAIEKTALNAARKCRRVYRKKKVLRNILVD